MDAQTLRSSRYRGCRSLAAAALVVVGAAVLPRPATAQEPPTTPPTEGTEPLAPAGSEACTVLGTGVVVGGAVLPQVGLDPSTLQPVTGAVDETCTAFPPPSDTVVCPMDDEVASEIVSLTLPLAAPVPLPRVAVLGITVETLRALAEATGSPGAADPIGDLLACSTIPGWPGTAPGAPATPGSGPAAGAPSAAPIEPAPVFPTASAPHSAAASAGAGQGAPAQPVLPAPAATVGFSPVIPGLPPEAEPLIVLITAAVIGAAAWAWGRAGRRAAAAATNLSRA